MKNADVIVIGGGHVGTSLALALRDKASVILIDTLAPVDRADPEKDNRMFALAEGSKRVLERLGVWDHLAKFATPIAHIHVSNKGSFGASRLHAADFDLPAMGYMCASTDLQTSLQQAAAQQVEHRYPATCVDIQPKEGTITLNTGETLSADIIIATDGQSSMARQQLSIETHHKAYDQDAIVAKIQLAMSHHFTAYERFVDDGAIALLPYGPQTCALIWSLPSAQAEDFMAMDEAVFLQTLQQAFGYRLGKFQGLSPRFRYPLVQTQAERIHQDRVVLLGNAAQTLHPIAAQGFNLALRHVALLADLYTAYATPQALIQAYAASQSQDTQHTRLFTEGLVRFFSDPGIGQLHFVRGGLLTAFDLCPPAKRYLLKGVMKGAIGKNTCNKHKNSLQ